mgnify:CR=1 FL=1
MEPEIQIHIAGMIYNQSINGTYSLVMMENEGLKRRFSILIGEAEAQSIALKLNNAKPPRPLSHDLMNTIIRELNARVVKVVIYDMVNDIFYSEIYLMQSDKPIIIDSRTSDAIALAVRSDAPIYIKSSILEIVGAVVDEGEEEVKEEKEKRTSPIDDHLLESLTPQRIGELGNKLLSELLKKAVEDEKYEIAALIRDELERRK